MTDIERLADVFVEVADTLVADFDLIEFLHLVAARAAELSGGGVAGIVMADEQGRLHHMASSQEEARVLEVLQVQQQEGPCLDCYRSGEQVVNLDLAANSLQWPVFGPAATAAGMRSVHAFPMRLRDQVLGALNVFVPDERTLSRSEVRVVQALTDAATIAVLQERAIARAELLQEQLQGALNSRVVIEQAKGAVSRALRVSVDEAFEMMRLAARHDRAPLTEFARQLLTSPTAIKRLGTTGPSTGGGAVGSR